jgi:ABC-type branched-subunit amino acid transport system ATPase component
MTQPALLLLDEPSLGLSPLIASELFAVLAGVAREGAVSILVVEQSARRALALAERAYLLSMGRIVAEGDTGIFAHDSLVARSYLGG